MVAAIQRLPRSCRLVSGRRVQYANRQVMVDQQGAKQHEQVSNGVAEGFHRQLRVITEPQPQCMEQEHNAQHHSGDQVDQATHAGEREVKKALRQTLFKYKLHQDAELFERAYGYIREYY